jgi:hypothetical protein
MEAGKKRLSGDTARAATTDEVKDLGREARDWSCPAYVPVSQLLYAAFRSNAKGLFPPNDECRRLGL